MLIQPPIDKLIEIVDCKYTLCSVVAKRARAVQDKYAKELEESGKKAISYAAEEVFEGKVKASAE